MDVAPVPPLALTLVVSPSGLPRLAPAAADDAAVAGDRTLAMVAAFDSGSGAGVLHLGSVEVGTDLPPAFSYYRELGHELVARVCAHPELETLRHRIVVEPPVDRLERLAGAAPPMTGGEYITTESLAAVWRDANQALGRELTGWRGPVAEWLHAKNAAWATVGRVCFHLAENKRDPQAPFAFLATYTTRLSAKGAAQHRPLGHALEESRTAGDRDRLLALLLPVQRAAQKSALLREMVERGDVYHPMRWTPREAHAFLKEVPALESAGVVVRVPDWWSTKAPPRPQVHVTVGGRPPSQLGTDAVLDFSVHLALDGDPLSSEERLAILQATDGLVLIKGRWVEADGARLREVLDRWKRVEQTAKREGVSFHEAMRMLAGGPADDDAGGTLPEGASAWSRVEPGPWMKQVLDGLQTPDALAPVDPGGELHASLRPYQRVGVQWLWWAHELAIEPVTIEGRVIARSFWGKAWCDHLEGYSDYANRLPRGRTYVRNGSVLHLSVGPGRIDALVQGSELYEVAVSVTPLARPRWKGIVSGCSGKIDSLVELLQGKLSAGVMRVVIDRDRGLFPAPSQIRMECSCPDWAQMCKHISAVLYGIGARLDERPELLFTLRKVDHRELVSASAAAPGPARRPDARAIAPSDLGSVFGIDIDTEPARRVRRSRRSR